MSATDSIFQTLLKEEVSAYGQLKKFSAGSVILQEDSYIKAIPLVLNGSLKVMRTDKDGHEILLYYITPGESCIMSFLGVFITKPVRSRLWWKKTRRFSLSR